MDRNELLKRINDYGKVHGYPLFVMSDRRILKTPPQDEAFRFIVFDELDIDKSLARQSIMTYEIWLKRTPSIASAPQTPEQADFPEILKIPPYLKPKIYRVNNKTIYIYAENNVAYWVEMIREDGEQKKEGLVIHFPFAQLFCVKVDQFTRKKNIFYYLH